MIIMTDIQRCSYTQIQARAINAGTWVASLVMAAPTWARLSLIQTKNTYFLFFGAPYDTFQQKLCLLIFLHQFNKSLCNSQHHVITF